MIRQCERPHVHILMCTRNGARFLEEQLASFLTQSHADWSLWVSDDGSDDATLTILEDFRSANPSRAVHVFSGPGRGSGANFLSLLGTNGPPAGHVALSDQDDVWLPDRLERALDRLALCRLGAPAIYGGTTIEVRADLTRLPSVRRRRKTPSFANALIQNTLPGNTILMNPRAYSLVREAARKAAEVPHHDWWLYALMTGIGAEITFDDKPTVLYRQHGGNSVGAHRGMGATLQRFAILASSRYGGWLRANAAALAADGLPLTSENATLLREFRSALDAPAPQRLARLGRLGIRRQSGFGTACIYAATAMGWI
ncbi:glycosyltransferase family 2 protein [Ostreiculturibacter nitratireducens]|uniref:glycosyltransferase family 2 protein n=1 Tax=Ostreiculturibacter nitratireducens TaxID=3075226 RepID=UPI0031B62211